MKDKNKWLAVFVYAAAMAWVESAVVFYLRTMVHRIEPYQANPFPVIGSIDKVELVREAATLLMLATVGFLAGRTWRQRVGYFAIAFGVWDILYYIFLRVICGWPHSLMDWDILFLIPLPWWGPVLAPVLISLLLIAWGTMLSQFGHVPAALRRRMIAVAIGAMGVTLALRVFMADALAAAPHGAEAIRKVLPKTFNWSLFLTALMLMAIPVLHLVPQVTKQPKPA